MGRYTVVSGDSLSKIAKRYDIEWRDLYEHPFNAEFREKRPNPDLIHPGDVLWVPADDDLDPPWAAFDGPRSLADLDDEPVIDTEHLNSQIFHEAGNVGEVVIAEGDTLESIADELGCTPEDVAAVNWATEDSGDVEWYLQNEFAGEKNPEGQLAFTSADAGETLLVPQAVESSSLGGRRTLRASRWQRA